MKIFEAEKEAGLEKAIASQTSTIGGS